MLPSQLPARVPLPGLTDRFLTDAGLETELVFHDGLDLPSFCSAVLLETAAGRRRLRQYYASFVTLARSVGRGVLFETATWRNNPDWATKIGYGETGRIRLDHAAVALLQDLRLDAGLPADQFVISGNLGPRFDGYDGTTTMSVEEARIYHQAQVTSLAAAGADAVSALTMTNFAEAAGIARAAARVGIPVVISFTLETDGRLPSGETLGSVIERVDQDAPDAVAYFAINCAHPTHFMDTLRAGGAWRERIGMVRANASCKSHAELDESTVLDAGDPEALGREYRALHELLPNLRVLGGCCGTDLRHVTEIVTRCDAVKAAG